MLHLKEIPETNIVELTLDGKISQEDFMVVTTILENKIKKQGKLKILEEVKSFDGLPLKLWWKDLKFGLIHRNDFEKAAVVSDKIWLRLLTQAIKPFTKGEVRFFKHRHVRDARLWLTK